MGEGVQAGVPFRRPFCTCRGVHVAHTHLSVELATHWTFDAAICLVPLGVVPSRVCNGLAHMDMGGLHLAVSRACSS